MKTVLSSITLAALHAIFAMVLSLMNATNAKSTLTVAKTACAHVKATGTAKMTVAHTVD